MKAANLSLSSTTLQVPSLTSRKPSGLLRGLHLQRSHLSGELSGNIWKAELDSQICDLGSKSTKVKTGPRSPYQHSPQRTDSRKKGPGTLELEGSGPYCGAASCCRRGPGKPRGLLMVTHRPLSWVVHSLVVRSFWYC